MADHCWVFKKVVDIAILSGEAKQPTIWSLNRFVVPRVRIIKKAMLELGRGHDAKRPGAWNCSAQKNLSRVRDQEEVCRPGPCPQTWRVDSVGRRVHTPISIMFPQPKTYLFTYIIYFYILHRAGLGEAHWVYKFHCPIASPQAIYIYIYMYINI